MSSTIRIASAAAALAATFAGALVARSAEPVLVNVERSATAPVFLPGGSLLIGGRGFVPNSGLIFYVDQFGNEASILGGLPFAGSAAYQAADVNGDSRVSVTDILFLIEHLFVGGPGPRPVPPEPDGLVARGDTLYVAAGEIVRPPRSATPERGAVLRIRFSAGLGLRPVFFLGDQAYGSLVDGETVVLSNAAGDTASVTLLVNGVAAVSGLAIDETRGRLYIVSRVDGSTSWIPLG